MGDKSACFIHALSSHVFLSLLWTTISEHSVNYQSDLRYITKLCQRHQEPARLCRLTPDHLLWKHLLPSCHQRSCQAKIQFEVMYCTVSSQATALYHFLGQKGLRHFLEKMCPLVLYLYGTTILAQVDTKLSNLPLPVFCISAIT